MTQRELFTEAIDQTDQSCPGCGHIGLRIEDASTGRAQCVRCGWRIRIAADGTAQSWLKIGTAKKRPRRGVR